MSKAVEIKKSIRIENIVASTSVGHEVDLDHAALVMGGKYDPERFPGLVYRTTNPKTAALIFHSGKIVCTGAKRMEDVGKGLDRLFEKMESVGIKVMPDPEVVVQNIVASADFGTPLNLNSVCISLGLENVEYEPEQFPGLVCHMDVPKVVLLLFGSGKLVIAGGKKPEDTEKAAERITRELESSALI